jgi:hypothetical protein
MRVLLERLMVAAIGMATPLLTAAATTKKPTRKATRTKAQAARPVRGKKAPARPKPPGTRQKGAGAAETRRTPQERQVESCCQTGAARGPRPSQGAGDGQGARAAPRADDAAAQTRGADCPRVSPPSGERQVCGLGHAALALAFRRRGHPVRGPME